MNEIDTIIKESNLKELVEDYSEIVIDNFLPDSLLKEIPIVSTICSFYKFGNAVSEGIFKKKLLRFLFQLSRVSAKNRTKEIDKINKSKKYENTVGETLIELLDKIDSEKKPKILGKLFKSFLSQEIDYITFLKLAHILNLCFIQDLLELKNNSKDKKIFGNHSDQLVMLGIYSTDFAELFNDSKQNIEKESYSELTELGEKLVKYGL